MKAKTLCIILLFGVEAVLCYPGSRTEHVSVKCNSSKKNPSIFSGFKTHYNCRNDKYFTSNFTFQRSEVPDDKVAWSTNMSWYIPLYFNEYHDEPWVDKFVKQSHGPNLPQPLYNSMDGLINRISYHGPYNVSENGFPYNPIGRTGICGRGVLGRWGPNHAVMVFVTRWARKNNNHIILNCDTGKPMLQFLGLLYRIRGHLFWTVPGGFIDAGESTDNAAKREFLEEAFDYEDEEKTELERKTLRELMDTLLKNGTDVYKGYADDPRNTDNAWVEVVVKHFHDQTGKQVSALPLAAGENFAGASWAEFSGDWVNVISHQKPYFQLIAERMGAHW